MKILRLDLLAIGPFTDVSLDLSAGKHGLHLIHGPNEAGKSSALRALRSLFYGIPPRTDDNFIHHYTKLRIGAELAHSSGEKLHVVRRKANRDTLRAGDDSTVVSDAVLAEYLGNVSEHLFETLFGIDHELLREGGKQILEGGGNVGEILFSAGTGMANLRALEQSLDADADRLFKKGGSNPSINNAVKELETLRTAVKELRLASDEWKRHHDALEGSRSRLAALAADLEKNKREKSRLERMRRVMPFLSERRELLTRLSTLTSVVLLPTSFSAERQKLQTRLAVTRESEVDALRELERIDKERESLPNFPSALSSPETMRELEQALGSHRKAQRDLPRIREQFEGLTREAEALLREVRPDLALDAVEEVRIEKRERVLIQNLGNRFQAIRQEEDRARREEESLLQRYELAQNGLKSIPTPFDATELALAVRRAQALGDLERQLQVVADEADRMERQVNLQLARLRGWNGGMDGLESVPLPSLETIEQFESRLSELDRRLFVGREQFDKVIDELSECEQKIQELISAGLVPTEEDLLAARERRDNAWTALRRAWSVIATSGSGTSAEESTFGASANDDVESLMQAHEAATRLADDLVDRLRREAERVANLANLQARKKGADSKKQRFQEGLTKLETARAELEAEWSAIWSNCRMIAASPKEMRAWHHAAGEILRLTGTMRERQAQAFSLRTQVDKHRQELLSCLATVQKTSLGEASLQELVDRAQDVLEASRKDRETRTQLEREIVEVERGLAAARQRVANAATELASWNRQWSDAMEGLGLPPNALPEQANDAIAQLQNLFAKLEKAEEFRKRVVAIGHDHEQFAEHVSRWATRVGLEVQDVPVDELADRLLERFREALQTKEKGETLDIQRQRTAEKVQRLHEQRVEASAAIEAMCRQAGCDAPEDLPRAERESDEAQKLRTRLEQVETQLRQLAAGASLNDLDDEVRGLDIDGLPHQLEQATAEVERLEKERSDLAAIVAVEENELKRMDGGSAAAEAEQRAQELITRVAHDAERYVRLRLAKRVLLRAVERYRERHQGPVLRRASELFAELTCGSFEGLREEYEEGAAVLKGIRAGVKELVGVKAMSAGTADQLYLAIRLATLEAHFEKSEPIPFIVDDVLINFDDERSTACLSVLARFSKRTQVLFFTHHDHLLSLAKKHLRKNDFFVHSLSPRTERVEGTLFTN